MIPSDLRPFGVTLPLTGPAPTALPAAPGLAMKPTGGSGSLLMLAEAGWQGFLQGVDPFWGHWPSEGALFAFLQQNGAADLCWISFQTAYAAAAKLVSPSGLPEYDRMVAGLAPGVEPPSRHDYQRLQASLGKAGVDRDPETLAMVATLLCLGMSCAQISQFLQARHPAMGEAAAPAAPSSSAGSGEASAPAGPPPVPAAPSSSSTPTGSSATTSSAPTTHSPLPTDRSGLESERQSTWSELSQAQGQLQSAQAELATTRERKLNCLGEALADPAARQQFEAASQDYQSSQANQAQLKSTRGQKTQELSQTRSQITVQEAKLESATADRAAADGQVADLESQVQTATTPDQQEGQAALQSQLSAARARAQESARRQHEAQASLEALRASEGALTAELAELEISLADEEERGHQALARMDEARQVQPGATAGELASDPAIAQAESRVQALESQVGQLQTRLSEIDARLAALQAELERQQPPDAGLLPAELEGNEGGPASSLISDLNGEDGYNCWEASTLYALANPGQELQLLQDSDGSHHAVTVSGDGNWVVFDGNQRLEPPVRLSDYRARNQAEGHDYRFFVRPDGSTVGPVPPSILSDPVLRREAFQPGGALWGVPETAGFADSPAEFRIPASIQASSHPDDHRPPLDPPLRRVALVDLPTNLQSQIRAAVAMAVNTGTGSGVSLDSTGQAVYIDASGQLVELTRTGAVGYHTTRPSVLRAFDGVDMHDEQAVHSAMNVALSLSGQGPGQALSLDRPLTAEEVEAYQALGYSVAVLDPEHGLAAIRPSGSQGAQDITNISSQPDARPVVMLLGGPELALGEVPPQRVLEIARQLESAQTGPIFSEIINPASWGLSPESSEQEWALVTHLVADTFPPTPYGVGGEPYLQGFVSNTNAVLSSSGSEGGARRAAVARVLALASASQDQSYADTRDLGAMALQLVSTSPEAAGSFVEQLTTDQMSAFLNELGLGGPEDFDPYLNQADPVTSESDLARFITLLGQAMPSPAGDRFFQLVLQQPYSWSGTLTHSLDEGLSQRLGTEPSPDQSLQATALLYAMERAGDRVHPPDDALAAAVAGTLEASTGLGQGSLSSLVRSLQQGVAPDLSSLSSEQQTQVLEWLTQAAGQDQGSSSAALLSLGSLVASSSASATAAFLELLGPQGVSALFEPVSVGSGLTGPWTFSVGSWSRTGLAGMLSHVSEIGVTEQTAFLTTMAFQALAPSSYDDPSLRAAMASALGTVLQHEDPAAARALATRLEGFLEASGWRELLVGNTVSANDRALVLRLIMENGLEANTLSAQGGQGFDNRVFRELFAQGVANQVFVDDPQVAASVGSRLADFLSDSDWRSVFLGQGVAPEVQTRLRQLLGENPDWTVQTLSQSGVGWENRQILEAYSAGPMQMVELLQPEAARFQAGSPELMDYLVRLSFPGVDPSMLHPDQLTCVRQVADQIQSLHPGQEIELRRLPVVYSSNATGPVTLPLFQVRSGGQISYLDNNGNYYNSLEAYRAGNRLPPGQVVIPDPSNPQGYTITATPSVVDSDWERREQFLNHASLALGTIGGLALVFTGLGSPVGLAALGAVTLSGGYQGIISLRELSGLSERRQSLFGEEALGHWFNLAGSVLSVGSLGVGWASTLARQGGWMQRGLATTARVVGVAGQSADIGGLGFFGLQLAEGWDQMSPDERFWSVMQLGFFGGMSVLPLARSGVARPGSLQDIPLGSLPLYARQTGTMIDFGTGWTFVRGNQRGRVTDFTILRHAGNNEVVILTHAGQDGRAPHLDRALDYIVRNRIPGEVRIITCHPGQTAAATGFTNGFPVEWSGETLVSWDRTTRRLTIREATGPAAADEQSLGLLSRLFGPRATSGVIPPSMTYEMQPLGADYVGEHLPNNSVFGTQVTYLDEAGRQPYHLEVRNGLLYDATGNLFDTTRARSAHTGAGTAIFVMDAQGNFYSTMVHAVGEFHHSSFLAGQPVAAAGEMVVTNGRIVRITNRSGHYRPPGRLVDQAVARLEQLGVDVSGVERFYLDR